MLAAALLALPPSAKAAPAEGTAGQTVTGRSFHRHDAQVRARSTAAVPPQTTTAINPSKPAWKSLTPAQQQALHPLASHWDQLSQERKRKWLVISENFRNLSQEEQAKLHRRMSKWATLSQQERTQARQTFKELKGVDAEHKAAQWQAYLALSPEERRELAAKAGAPPTGVARPKPGTAPKLAQVPGRQKPSVGARMAEYDPRIQQHTLLPRQEPLAVESVSSPYEDEPSTDQ